MATNKVVPKVPVFKPPAQAAVSEPAGAGANMSDKVGGPKLRDGRGWGTCIRCGGFGVSFQHRFDNKHIASFPFTSGR